MLTLTATPPPDPEAQARARHAAEEYLRLANADPAACWAQIERLGMGGAYDPRLARIWQQAESAAVVAAYGGWRKAPLSVWLDWEADA